MIAFVLCREKMYIFIYICQPRMCQFIIYNIYIYFFLCIEQMLSFLYEIVFAKLE